MATTKTCECGYQTDNGGCLTNHRRRCIGPRPTIADLYRVGRVEPGAADDCHEWGARIAGTPEGRYGVLPPVAAGQIGEALAHRAALVLATGEPLPDGVLALHSCDNPMCVNPAHLRAGSRQDNTDDMYRRRRHPWARNYEPPAALRA